MKRKIITAILAITVVFSALRVDQPKTRAAIHRKQQYPICRTARKEYLKLQGIRSLKK